MYALSVSPNFEYAVPGFDDSSNRRGTAGHSLANIRRCSNNATKTSKFQLHSSGKQRTKLDTLWKN